MSRAVLRKRKKQLKQSGQLTMMRDADHESEKLSVGIHRQAKQSNLTHRAAGHAATHSRDHNPNDSDNSFQSEENSDYDEEKPYFDRSRLKIAGDAVGLDDYGIPFTAFDDNMKILATEEFSDVNLEGTTSTVEQFDTTVVTVQELQRLEDVVDVTSVQKADLLLQKLLEPAATTEEFWAQCWETKPIYSKQQQSETISAGKGRQSLFSRKMFMGIVSKHLLREGSDVEFYSDGLPTVSFAQRAAEAADRESGAAAGGAAGAEREVSAEEVHRQLAQGNAVLLHEPQQFSDVLWKLMSGLEFAFNSHLTATAVLMQPDPLRQQQPRGVSIKAPYFESSRCTLVVQLQGSSRWRVVPYHRISDGAKRYAHQLRQDNPAADDTADDQPGSDGTNASSADDFDLRQLPLHSTHLQHNAISSSSSSKPISARSAAGDGCKGNEDFSIDEVLQPGDVLYIPKEAVYEQQHTGEVSLHLQLHIGGNADGSLLPVISSRNSNSSGSGGGGEEGDVLLEMGNSLGSLLQIALPQAVAEAIHSDRRMRRLLPRGARTVLGVAASDADEEFVEAADQPHHCGGGGSSGRDARAMMKQQIETIVRSSLLPALLQVLDPAADQLAKRFIAQRLPVPLSQSEEARSAAAAPNAAVYPYTKLRLLRPGIAITAVEDGKVVLYHCMDNARYSELH